MYREHHRWWSPALNRPMDLLAFGHAGATLLAFPTSQARFYEWEERGMIHAVAHRIDAGHLRVVCVDSVDSESWYARDKPPGGRAFRQVEYDGYVAGEVLPFVAGRGGDQYLITAGASFGAFHALSVAFRHPCRVNRVLAMSGLCDIRLFTGGYSDAHVYHTNPVDFIPGEHDPHRLNALRRQDIILAVGDGDRLVHQNRTLSGQLWAKGVGHALREWDGFAHDWPVWHHMLNVYVGGHD